MSHMDSDTQTFAHAVSERGWAITPPVLSAGQVSSLRADLETVTPDGRGGARNLLEQASIAALAASCTVRSFAAAVLGSNAFAVRALLFDKTPTANWKVSWHQDLSIPTRTREDVDGYGPWSEKAGVPHVQPPVAILERMLAVRLHLDPSCADNGPVRVLSGSHRLGRLAGAQIDSLRAQHDEIECLVAEGGILAFRPLLLHASAPARAPLHRRVIHIEYAAAELLSPLEWHRRIA
jgi:ectoine hydroxylase-related dioxygenase (phytanoyl-CoA dioxygenase family)